jgi:co-chaperonin GroES (HSP10)
MNCKTPNCVYSNKYKKCILPNPYVEALAECKRKNIKKKDCYKDKERFPNGPYCKEGDFILVRPNAGTRLVIHGREFRIINDDSVEAVVQDPRGITRKFI